MDGVNDGVVIIDTDHKIRFANERALKLLGYTIDDVIGCRCREILQTSLCESDCPLARGLESGVDTGDVPMCYTPRNGKSLYAISSFRLLRDDEGRIIGGAEIFADVTHVEELKADLEKRYSFAGIIGKSYQMQEIYRVVSEAACSDMPVFISGERGTGKELIARIIHQFSPRSGKPFISYDCRNRSGKILGDDLSGIISTAENEPDKHPDSTPAGTIFLKNIEEVSPATLERLLIFLQRNAQRRTGEKNAPFTRYMVSGALSPEVLARKKRCDGGLLTSINLMRISVPPLRNRKEDIPLLTDYFCKRKRGLPSCEVKRNVSPQAIKLLMQYDFPGNVEELESIIERSCVCSEGEMIKPANIPDEIIGKITGNINSASQSDKPLKAVEDDMIRVALARNNGHLQKTAEQLGISRVTLWRRLKKHNMQGEFK